MTKQLTHAFLVVMVILVLNLPPDMCITLDRITCNTHMNEDVSTLGYTAFLGLVHQESIIVMNSFGLVKLFACRHSQ